jgi:hypothetical protein
MILTTILHPNGVIFVEEATYMIALDLLKQFSGMKIVTGLFTNVVSDGPCTIVFFIKKSALYMVGHYCHFSQLSSFGLAGLRQLSMISP